jgi:hypothetical protein
MAKKESMKAREVEKKRAKYAEKKSFVRGWNFVGLQIT